MTWTRVTTLDDLTVGRAIRVDIGELPLCVVRLDERTVKVVHDICSHQEEELHEGWVDGNAIECPAHGSTFDLDTGDPQALPAVKPVPTYPVQIDAAGTVYVDPEQQLNDAPVPKH